MSSRQNFISKSFSIEKIKNLFIEFFCCFAAEFLLFQPLHNFFLSYDKNSKFSNQFYRIINEYRNRSLQIWILGFSLFLLALSLALKKNSKKGDNSEKLKHILICSFSCVLFELIFLEPLHEIISHYFCKTHHDYSNILWRSYSNYYFEKPSSFWIIIGSCFFGLFLLNYSSTKKKSGEPKSNYFIHVILCSLLCFWFEIVFLEPLHHAMCHSHQIFGIFDAFSTLIDGYMERPLYFWLLSFVSFFPIALLHSLYENNEIGCCHGGSHEKNEQSYCSFAVDKIYEVVKKPFEIILN